MRMGINVLGQAMMMDFGSPKQIERAMETARRLEWLTGVNAAGHGICGPSYYSGAKMAEGGVWGWTKARSYIVFHPAMQLVLFNGAPETRKMVLEMADGMLAHASRGRTARYGMRATIKFKTDQDRVRTALLRGSCTGRRTGGQGTRSICIRLDDDRGGFAAADQLRCAGYAEVRDTWGKQLLRTARSADRLGTASETNRASGVAGDRRHEVSRASCTRAD